MSNILKTAVRSTALTTGLWILILQIPSCDSHKGIVHSPVISPVLLVGIDGATFDRIDSLAARGAHQGCATGRDGHGGFGSWIRPHREAPVVGWALEATPRWASGS
jgi:hypothetical protein